MCATSVGGAGAAVAAGRRSVPRFRIRSATPLQSNDQAQQSAGPASLDLICSCYLRGLHLGGGESMRCRYRYWHRYMQAQ